MSVVGVQLDGVSFRYPSKESSFSIENVDLDIEKGGYLTILGPSGCGKTTLLKLMAGFLRPCSGKIYVDGVDVTDARPGTRSIVTVFQEPHLFPHLTVLENVHFGLKAKGLSKEEASERADAMLVRLRIADCCYYLPAQLSGGQKHRVALARALVLQPRVLLLDEPLAAIDDPLRGGIETLLSEINRELNITFVEVTHIQEHALAVSSRIAIMENGKVLEVSTPNNIYYRPRTTFAARFLGGANILSGRIDLSSSVEPIFRCQEGGFKASFRAQGKECFMPNQRASFILRPESISLAQSVLYDNNSEAKVCDVTFRGGHIDYRLSVNGTELKARTPAFGSPPLNREQYVKIYWSSSDALVIPVS
jgi:ABC-type Fe3+/spermidine/putrescine transport system ATPase subunit